MKDTGRAITGDGVCIRLIYRENAFVHPQTKHCRELAREIVSELQSHDELRGIELTSIQISHNTISAPRTDSNRVGFPSVAIGLGDYEGGKLRVEGSAPIGLRNHAVVFDGLKTILHRSSTAIGGRSY